MEQSELRQIIARFRDSGWELISVPGEAYLSGKGSLAELTAAVQEADAVCGSCGCEYDALYKRFLALVSAD